MAIPTYNEVFGSVRAICQLSSRTYQQRMQLQQLLENLYHIYPSHFTEQCLPYVAQMIPGTPQEPWTSYKSPQDFRRYYPLMPHAFFHAEIQLEHHVRNLHAWFELPCWSHISAMTMTLSSIGRSQHTIIAELEARPHLWDAIERLHLRHHVRYLTNQRVASDSQPIDAIFDVARLSNLQHLTVSGNQHSNALILGLAHSNVINTLQSLQLIDLNVSTECVESLKNLMALESLRCERVPLTPQSIQNLCEHLHWTDTLILSECDIHDDGLNALTETQLRCDKLDLRRNTFSTQSLISFMTHPTGQQLHHLKVSGIDYTVLAAEAPQMPRLTRFDMEHVSNPGDILPQSPMLQSIKHLGLASIPDVAQMKKVLSAPWWKQLESLSIALYEQAVAHELVTAPAVAGLKSVSIYATQVLGRWLLALFTDQTALQHLETLVLDALVEFDDHQHWAQEIFANRTLPSLQTLTIFSTTYTRDQFEASQL